MKITLIKTKHDGYRYALCKHGSWLPLMICMSLSEAREAAK